MAREQYVNNAFSPLDGAINNSVTSVVVDDGTVFPSANFRVRIDDEIMFCSSRSGNTLTVIRGIEGTTAASHADNAEVDSPYTAGAVSQVRLDTLAAAGVPRIAATSHAADDEFDDESFSGWTKVAHGTNGPTTEVERDHSLSIHAATGSAAAQLTAFLKARTISAGDWVSCGFQMFGPGGQFPIAGLIFADGNTYNAGNQVVFSYSPNETKHRLAVMSGFNTFPGTVSDATTIINPVAAYINIKMEYLGSNNWDCYTGDGIQWAKTHSSVSMGSMTPTHLGFYVTTWGSLQEYVFNFKYVRFKP